MTVSDSGIAEQILGTDHGIELFGFAEPLTSSTANQAKRLVLLGSFYIGEASQEPMRQHTWRADGPR